MRTPSRWVVLGMLAALGAGGCSSASPLGGLSPRYPLLDEAAAMRQPTGQPLPRELNKTTIAEYVVEPGDGLLVVPADLDSPIRIPADQTVLPDGTIDLGRYGRLRVAGQTVPQIEAMVREAVAAKEKGKDKETEAGFINVRLINRQSKVYYVQGEVNSPGAFPYNGRETAMDAIVAAGGLTERAATGRIVLSRPSPPEGCRTVLAVCYNEIVQLGDTSSNYQLLPGDRIFVPSKTFWETLCPSKTSCAWCQTMHVPCPPGGLAGCTPEQPMAPPAAGPRVLPE